MMYSISSQICSDEQGNGKLSFNIDLEVILNEKSHSDRPTPHAKKEIAEEIQRNLYKSLPKNRSEEKQMSPEYSQGLVQNPLKVEDFQALGEEEKEEEELLVHDDE